MLNLKSKIYVAGSTGLVGSAIVRKLKKDGYKNIIISKRKNLNLTDQSKVYKFLQKTKPDFMFIASAKVGGIYANNRFKGSFIYENLSIQLNLIHGAYLSGVKNLIFLGSSCVYPRNCKQPIKEDYLMTGPLESTNDSYAVAKIAGIKLCQSYNEQYKTNFKCLMPTNTFGPNDNYDNLNSHFFPALLKKVHNLKKNKKQSLLIWGNGKAKREVIYVDELANACVYFMKKKTNHFLINIGTGKDYSIKHYAELISKIILPNKKITIKYDKSKPNGTPRKVMDISLAKKYGWQSQMKLNDAVDLTYKSYLKNLN